MKRLLSAALIAALCTGAHAERAANYEEALARAASTKQDIVVLERGSDWNRLGERIYSDVWMKPAFESALGKGFVLVDVDSPEIVGGQAAQWLKQFADKNLQPLPSELSAVESANNSVKYDARPDGAFLIGSKPVAKDTLTLKLVAKHAGSVVRIDFPTDPSLPGNGPGCAANGNFLIQEVEVVSDGTAQKPRAAWVSKAYGSNDASQLIDGVVQAKNYWNPSANEHEQRTLLIVLPQAVAAGAQVKLRLICTSEYDQHIPGCLRASVLAEPNAESNLLAALAAKELQVKNAKFTWRGSNVPRISLLDRDGRAVTSFDNPRSNLTPATLAARVREMQKVRVQRDALWAAADKAQGPARAELLRQSLDLLHLGNSPGQDKAYAFVHEQIKTADPDDKSGVQRWLQFTEDSRNLPPFVGAALKLAGEKKFEEALAALDRELADPRNKILDHDRIQRIMLGRFHVYRTWPGHEEQRFDELRKIAELDPTTYQGIGAVGYRNMHYRTPTPELVYYGWGAAQVKPGVNTWDLKISENDNLDHAGAYNLSIRHGGGKDTVKIRRVALVQNGKVTFETKPEADLAPKGKVEIPLTVKSWNPAQKSFIRLELEAADGKADCAGRFDIEPLLEAPAR